MSVYIKKSGKWEPLSTNTFPIALIVTVNGVPHRWESEAVITPDKFTAKFVNCPFTADITAAQVELQMGGSVMQFPTTLYHFTSINAGDTFQLNHIDFNHTTPVGADPTASFTCMWCAVGPFPDQTTLEEHEERCR